MPGADLTIYGLWALHPGPRSEHVRREDLQDIARKVDRPPRGAVAVPAQPDHPRRRRHRDAKRARLLSGVARVALSRLIGCCSRMVA